MYGSKKRFLSSILVFLVLIVFSFNVTAHGDEEEQEDELDIVSDLKNISYKLIIAASVIVIVVIAVSIASKPKTEKAKIFLFLGIAVPTLIATIFSAGSTVYLNINSETKGPVHWHADYEIWNCGEKIELVDPKGLSNKVGDAVFHEHDDDRVHVEGVVHEVGDDHVVDSLQPGVAQGVARALRVKLDRRLAFTDADLVRLIDADDSDLAGEAHDASPRSSRAGLRIRLYRLWRYPTALPIT